MSIHDPDPDHPEDPDGFSARLSSQSPAVMPEHWRTHILAAAKRALPPPAVNDSHRFRWLTAWMWPHPYAYAALASVWLLILTLRWFTPGGDTPAPRQIAGAALPANDPLALDRTQLAINTVLLSSSRQQEVRQ